MRPALYYPWIYLKGGAERVILQLVTRSRHEWTLFTNHFDSDSTFPEFTKLPVRKLKQVSVRRNVPDVARAGWTLMTQKIDLSGHSSLVVVSEGLGNLVAARSGVRTSCICLTPLKIVYDEVSRKRYFELGGSPQQRLATAIYARLEKPVWAKYERVFYNSSEVRRRLLAHSLVDESRLELLRHGVDATFFTPVEKRETFFLVAGRIMWSKNVELAIQAWQLFKPEPALSQHSLVIAGMVDAKSQGYFSWLKSLAAKRPDITFVESPSDAELLSLYQRCHAVVFTPPNEDWGLVPLEAMACAKPVLATARGGPLESVIDGETGFLREDTPLAFAEGIRQLASADEDQLEVMGLMARKRALAFTWDRFVERIDEHVEKRG